MFFVASLAMNPNPKDLQENGISDVHESFKG